MSLIATCISGGRGYRRAAPAQVGPVAPRGSTAAEFSKPGSPICPPR